jgi:hypothetical protein
LIIIELSMDLTSVVRYVNQAGASDLSRSDSQGVA